MNVDCLICGAESAELTQCAGQEFRSDPNVENVQKNDGLILMASNVPYLDENGVQQTCANATNVTSEDSTWSEGWYVVEETVAIDHTVNVSGNVNLILTDNSTLTINCSSGNGILVAADASLTVYAQSKTDNAGIFTANSAKDKTPGIKSNGGALSVVGAKVNSSYISFTDTNFTVKSGATVTVVGREDNYQGISYTNGTLEIIDSTVNVTHYRNDNGTGIYGNQKINTSGPKGTLVVKGNSNLNVWSDKLGIDVEVLEVYGGQVNVKVSTTSVFNGAIDAYDITVGGGSLTAEAEVTSGTYGASAFYMQGGVRSITVTDGKLTAIAKGPGYTLGINSPGTADLNISGGEVYLEATSETDSAYGARIKGYTITGGSLTNVANTGESPTESAGLYANGGYTIAGGTTTTMGDGWAFYQQFKPTVSESFRHVTYGNSAKSAEGAGIVDETQSGFDWNNYKYIRIEPKPKVGQTVTPDAPTLNRAAQSSITLNAVTSGENAHGVVEYGCVQGASGTPAAWQTGTTFENLMPGTVYTFYARYAGDDDYNPSGLSTGLTVCTAPEITTTSLADATVGQPYEVTIDVKSDESVTWSVSGGDWLSIDSSGKLTGTPTAAATQPVIITITATVDRGTNTASSTKQLPLIVNPARLAAPAGLIWNGSAATWNVVENASSYSVTLYKEGDGTSADTPVKTDTLNGTSYDFSESITEAGSYYVTVTAKGNETTVTVTMKTTESLSEALGDITPDNVTSDDQETIEDYLEDLTGRLEDENLTDEEKEIIQGLVDDAQDLFEIIRRVENVEEAIGALPDTVSPDDTEMEEQINAARDLYDELSEYEKSLVSEEATNKLETLLKDLRDYRIVEGDGAIWAKESGDGLTIVANGAYSKFTKIEIDGNAVSADNYTVASGSTVITLKPAYLDTLSLGDHTITVLYTDGEAVGTFTIVKKQDDPTEPTAPSDTNDIASVATGDNSSGALWIVLLFVSGASVTGTVVYKQKRKYHR